MITKQKKEQIIAKLVDKLQGVGGLYVIDFTKMTVADSLRLRRQLKEKGLQIMVAKNTLIQRALKETPGEFEFPESIFKGQSALVFGYADALAPAKILKEFSEKTDIPKLKAAIVEGQLFDGSQLKMMAALPSKNDLISGIIGSIHAPISGIVGSINAVMRDLASLIEEVAKKNAA